MTRIQARATIRVAWGLRLPRARASKRQKSPALSRSALAQRGLHLMQPVTCDDARQVRGWQEPFGPGTGPDPIARHTVDAH